MSVTLSLMDGWTNHDVSGYLFFHECYTFSEAKVRELVLP